MQPYVMNAALAVSSIFLAMSRVSAQASPSATVALKAMTYEGCFTSSEPLQDQGQYMYQSPGYCQNVCVKLNKPVMATANGSNCWCGDLLPAASSKTSDAECNSPCNGFDQDNCGGPNAWSVSLSGTESSVNNFGGSASSSSQSSSTTAAPTTTRTQAPSVVTEAGQTIVVTAASQASPTASKSHSSGGTNKAAIAAGVVVGVVGIAAIVGGIFLFMRYKKRQAAEEEYRRNAAVNSFVAKPKSPMSSADSRLDPSISTQRRMSDGSIADERDFSRRILQVRNPDGLS